MNLDIIVAVLGIISAIVGLLTAIIQLKNATHQRRHQESQDGRSYIDIGKWLKRALVLFGVPFAVLLIYREWNSVEKLWYSIWGVANKAIVIETKISTIAPKELEISNRIPGPYRIKVIAKNYTFFCNEKEHGNGMATKRQCENCTPGSEGHGNILLKSRVSEPRRDGEVIMIVGDEPIILDFDLSRYPIGYPKDRSKCLIIGKKEGMDVTIQLIPITM